MNDMGRDLRELHMLARLNTYGRPKSEADELYRRYIELKTKCHDEYGFGVMWDALWYGEFPAES